MMRKILALTLVLSLCLMLLPVPGYCILDLNNWHGSDRTRLLGRELAYDLKYTGSGRGGVSQIVSTVTPLTAANIAFGLIQLTHGSPGNHALPNGVTGQEITIELLADPWYTIIDDTPGEMTKTGWVSITFDTAYDRVTLLWVDDTNGWIITSNDGCAIAH